MPIDEAHEQVAVRLDGSSSLHEDGLMMAASGQQYQAPKKCQLLAGQDMHVDIPSGRPPVSLLSVRLSATMSGKSQDGGRVPVKAFPLKFMLTRVVKESRPKSRFPELHHKLLSL